MSRLRVAIAGAGSIGKVHLDGYAAAPRDIEIAAICDIDPFRLAAMGRNFAVPQAHLHTDWRRMLEAEDVDVLSVCLPNVFHHPAALAGLRKRLHVLIEKPMVLNLKEAEDIRREAAAARTKVMVAFSHRFITMNQAAKRLLDSGALGAPFMIRVRYSHGGPYPGWAQTDWFYKKRLAGGGALLDMGIHAIDICHYLIGPITSVQAEVTRLRRKIEVDDNAVLLLDFGKQKCLGYIECGWTSGPGFIGIEVFCDKGSIVLDLESGPYVRRMVKRGGKVSEKREPLKVPPRLSHWPGQMRAWVDHLRGRPTPVPLPGIAEGISSLKVALAATESSAKGRRIAIK